MGKPISLPIDTTQSTCQAQSFELPHPPVGLSKLVLF